MRLFFSLSLIVLSLGFVSNSYALSCSFFGGYKIDEAKKEVRYAVKSKSGMSENIDIEVKDVDFDTFEELVTMLGPWRACVIRYAKDKNHVFYEGKILENIDPTNFKTKGNDYTWTDGTHVVVEGKIVGKDDGPKVLKIPPETESKEKLY